MEEKQGRENRGLNKWMTLVASTALIVVMIFGYFHASDETQMKEYAPDDTFESKDVNIG
ncbi:hypothetical protein ACOMCU_00310 [Lysinibacillus sp. UGB7]|uniref:hypothetical protein n=1 Tax=Lysinibacillus sp. UGB7 TaxID=3411039 RepID=UPI003B7876BE